MAVADPADRGELVQPVRRAGHIGVGVAGIGVAVVGACHARNLAGRVQREIEGGKWAELYSVPNAKEPATSAGSLDLVH